MPSLDAFSLSDMIQCQATLRQLGADATSVEEVARRTVDHLFDLFRSADTGERSAVLVRFYKTHAFGDLPEDVKRFVVDRSGGHELNPETKCLTLLATRGTVDAWNSPDASERHRAIPLPGREVVEQSPMIAQLITQFGLAIEAVVAPDPNVIVELEQRAYNVFHVEDARGSPYVPDQDFVESHGVRSVVGFGGMLPSSDFFTVIIFSRDSISRGVAELFRTLSLSVKVAILPLSSVRVFAQRAAT
ncbi:MAG TPA: hypothetical protein VM573_08500 [Actinomycetota bacterium]|nr:hypothetical protein [Actinomycetota bacterium]